MKLKTFTIIEKRWARGGKNGFSALQNRHGNKCCLGFLARACGFHRLEGVSLPSQLVTSLKKPYPKERVRAKLKGLVRAKSCANTVVCNRIANINDNESFTDDQRKVKLALLFRKIGWKVKYV